MTEDASHSPQTSSKSIAFAGILLTLSLLLVFPFVAAYGYNAHGTQGVVAAALAAGICWTGALIALVLVGLFRGSPNQMVSATLLGMIFRMGLPMGAGLLLTQAGGPLAEANLFGMILVFYLVGLVSETILSVRLLGSSQRVAKAS